MMASVAGDWTLDELAGRVAEALAVGDVRAPNGRVTQVPDGRVIRWYTTIGIVDRPSSMRGRTALYGPRHLLQLVAIKRLQAQGRSLAEIQADLTGATDLTLHRLAAVPPRVLTTVEPGPLVDTSGSVSASPAHRGVAPRAATEGDALQDPPPLTPRAAPDGSTSASRWRFWAQAPKAAAHRTVAAAGDRDTVRAMHGLALGDGAVLLLPAPIPEHLGPDEVAAIQAAAQPLLDLLAARGRPPHSEPARPDDVRPDDVRPDDGPRAEGAHR
jgi:hypothetical protein